MKHLLLTTIAAVLLAGCGESQQSAPAPEAKPELSTAKVPNIPIYDAARRGDIVAVKQHIAAGTDVNAKDKSGRTPLYRAVEAAHKEIAELLIANGADVNAKGWNGWTPLHLAAFLGNKEIIELLIAKGADVNVKLENGETPLDWAIQYKEPEAADLLRKNGGKSSAADFIHIAAAVGNIEAVKQHLSAGTDVNAKKEGGATPLHSAVHRGQKKVVELLIAKGADVNAKTKRGQTPLDWVEAEKHKEIVDLLRNRGGKYSTIHFAAEGGNIETVKEFLAAGINVNAKDKDGDTPLDVAILFEHPVTIDLLRKLGGKTGAELKAEAK